MLDKKNPNQEDPKTTRLQLWLSFAVFVLMLITLIGIGLTKQEPTLLIVCTSFLCLFFAFLLREPLSSMAILRKMDVSVFKFFRISLSRDNAPEKHLPETFYVVPEKNRQPTTPENHFLLTAGREQLLNCEFEAAIKTYRKVIENQPDYWAAHVNEAYALSRAGKIEAALEKSKYIEKTCSDSKYIAQALINKGDFLHFQSVAQSNSELEVEAYRQYELAYSIDPKSIYSLFYCWVAKVVKEPSESQLLAKLIESHKDYDNLCEHSELIKFFRKYKKGVKNPKEQIIMDWKKLILTNMQLCYVLVSAVVMFIFGVVNG